jgi:anaerobic selenocysteine-containing dehydrogenase
VEAIRDTDGGAIFDVEDVIALPADPATASRLDLYPADLAEELSAAHADLTATGDPAFPLRLISRRLKYTYNSTGPELRMLGDKQNHNPAYMHPDDLAAIGVADGELVEICSPNGRVPAVAAASADIRPGVVSFSHCWGGSPDPDAGADDKVRQIGSNSNRLVDNRDRPEKYSGMPRQSTIEVAVRRLA